jgi:hypothetical protein
VDRNSRCYAHSERYSETCLSEVKILRVDALEANETRYLLIFLQTLTITWITKRKYHLSPSIRRVAGRIAGDALKQGWRTNGTRKGFLGTRYSLLSQVFDFFCPTSVSIFWRMCVYTRSWQLRDCVWITCDTKIILRVKHSYTNRSGAKFWLDIYHWGADLAVTWRIRDIGRNVLFFFSNRKQ